MPSKLFVLLIYFGGRFELRASRQALYHLSHSLNPFALFIFLALFAGPVSDQDPPTYGS
jgi:formate hydrogenlyase subunit 4